MLALGVWTNVKSGDFFQVELLTNVTGRCLAETLLKRVQRCDLKMKFLREQGYDVTSAMNGKLYHVQVYVKQKYSLAVYVYCAAHTEI
jgi:hypothetical protein